MSEPPQVPGWRSRLEDRSRRLAAWADSTVVGRLWQRLLEMEFVDRSVALAAKSFVTLFPLMVVAAALSPDRVRAAITSSLETRFGFTDESLALVQGALAAPEQIRSATGVLGAVLTLLYAVSFATAVQRVYLRAWRRPSRGGLRDKRRGLLWLGGILAFLALIGSVARIITGPPGTATALVLGLVLSTLMWWWTAHVMLRGEVRWRPLLPTAVLTGVGASLYAVAASVWMPRVLAGNVAQFGFIGVAMSMVTWFVGFAFLVVACAALAPALTDGEDRVARWLRGPDDDVLAPGAPPSLPAPAQQARLLDMLRSSRSELDET